MNRQLIKVGVIASVLLLVACGGNQSEQTTADIIEDTTTTAVELETPESMEKDGLKLYLADIAKDFPNAKLSLTAPMEGAKLKAGDVQFDFSVADYELAVQTEDAGMRHCANSQKGQHIHYILNNSPYLAKYEPSFKAELNEGNNVVLAFLSRSYHESIKNGSAFILKNFPVGNVESAFDINAPHLFYSRPKGEYAGKDTEKILVDFYLVNSDLQKDGNKVKLTINDTEFMIDQWAPYFVEGLPEGDNTFRIVLVDAAGNAIDGPFNDSGERTITLIKKTES